MAWQTISPLLFLIFTSLSLINLINTQEHPFFLGWKCLFLEGSYTKNSPYHSNLLDAFSNLTSLSSSNTFSNFTAGTLEDSPNQVFALYDCRNDLTLRTCHDCIKDASKSVLEKCPSSKEAIVYYKECMLRYANRPIFALMEVTPAFYHCEVSIPDDGVLNRTAEPMLKDLIDEATSEKSSRYFGLGDETYFKLQKVYSLVQCTPDISRDQCKECLMNSLNYTLRCSNFSFMRSYYYAPSCEMIYDVIPFFNLSSPGLSSSVPPTAPNLSPQVKASNRGQRLFSTKHFPLLLFFFFGFNFM